MSEDNPLKAALMNGVAPDPVEAAANIGAGDPILKILAALAEDRIAGRLDTVGIVAVGGDGSTRQMWGGNRFGDMYTGLGVLQFMIINHLLNPRNQGRIMRPGR